MKNKESKKKIITSNKKPMMGWVCTYTPREIFWAANLLPFRILPHADPSLANAYLDSNFCPFVRSCLGEALEGKIKGLDNLVLVNSCDAMRRLYDAWRYYNYKQDSFIYLLDLPRKDSMEALEYFQHNLELLIDRLEDRFKIKVSEDLLFRAISTSNKTRRLLAELYSLYANDKINLSGERLLQIIQNGMVSPPEEYQLFLEEYLENCSRRGNSTNALNSKGRRKPRLLITGTLLDDLELVKIIEEYGGKVVFIDTCNGNRYFEGRIAIPDWKANQRNLLKSLAEFYLYKCPCPRMVNLEKRWEYLRKVIQDYQVEGVIFYNLKFCDTSMFDLPIIRDRLQKDRIPSLFLEGEFSTPTTGRNKTRIQAFLEVLEFGR